MHSLAELRPLHYTKHISFPPNLSLYTKIAFFTWYHQSKINGKIGLIPLQINLSYIIVNEMPRQVLQNDIWSLSYKRTSCKLHQNGSDITVYSLIKNAENVISFSRYQYYFTLKHWFEIVNAPHIYHTILSVIIQSSENTLEWIRAIMHSDHNKKLLTEIAFYSHSYCDLYYISKKSLYHEKCVEWYLIYLISSI